VTWRTRKAQSHGMDNNLSIKCPRSSQKHLPGHGQGRIRVEMLHKVNSEAHACPLPAACFLHWPFAWNAKKAHIECKWDYWLSCHVHERFPIHPLAVIWTSKWCWQTSILDWQYHSIFRTLDNDPTRSNEDPRFSQIRSTIWGVNQFLSPASAICPLYSYYG